MPAKAGQCGQSRTAVMPTQTAPAAAKTAGGRGRQRGKGSQREGCE